MNATYAGFWLRFVAVIIDGILIAIVRSLLVLPILGVMGIGLAHDVQHLDTEDPSSVLPIVGTIIAFAGISMLISTVIWVLYYTLMESSKYQATVGKLALGLIVTDESGNKLDFAKALIRNLCKIISSMIMCIGYIMAGFTEKKQGLHDIIAKTLVVKKP
ncbi:MAG: RDD family protein [Bacteroidetes bacterium]|nr:RDD family protein [Bacteroidota bacterium]MBS1981828.1 RDD family protein [Bacteroidota bacterium]